MGDDMGFAVFSLILRALALCIASGCWLRCECVYLILCKGMHDNPLHVLQGPCPNCNEENSTYFGDILTVTGNRDKNTVTCTNCKSEMTFLSQKRQVGFASMG